jgi:hypothetical protein
MAVGDVPTLVVSDPPHGEVDLAAVAELLGLDVAGTRLKVAFPAPEVLSSADTGEAVEFAAALRGAGLTVAIIDGQRLAETPWPSPVTSLAFDRDGLTASLRADDVHVSFDAPVVGVYCSPSSDFFVEPPTDPAKAIGSGDGARIAESIQWMTVLDLYFEDGGSLRRVSIVPELADFSSLGELRRPTSADTMDALLDECRSRFARLKLDTRLAGVRPRQRFVMGETGFDPDLRKRYSFGTLLLCHVLDSISPELRDVPQYELGSRLSFALSPHRITTG